MKYPKVKVQHNRKSIGFRKVAKTGGRTIVSLEIRKGVGYVGEAYCWKGDVYNKRKGKSIAFGRLMKALDILDYSNWLRTKMWILSKIGKIDRSYYSDAYVGRKIE